MQEIWWMTTETEWKRDGWRGLRSPRNGLTPVTQILLKKKISSPPAAAMGQGPTTAFCSLMGSLSVR